MPIPTSKVYRGAGRFVVVSNSSKFRQRKERRFFPVTTRNVMPTNWYEYYLLLSSTPRQDGA